MMSVIAWVGDSVLIILSSSYYQLKERPARTGEITTYFGRVSEADWKRYITHARTHITHARHTIDLGGGK